MSFYLFFDKVLVLKADAKALNARLTTREGEDNIGNNQSGRDIVLDRKDAWEKMMEEKGAIFVDGNNKPDQVVKEILNKI